MNFFENPYIMAILKISFILYASMIAPEMPESVMIFLQYSVVRIIILTGVFMLSKIDFQMALLISIIYVMFINYISTGKLLESYTNAPFPDENPVYNSQLLLDDITHIYPGCLDITMEDIENALDIDSLSLQDTVSYSYNMLLKNSDFVNQADFVEKLGYAAGVHYNLPFTDENAPFIATILLLAGFKFSPTCQVPNDNPIVWD